MKRLYLVKAFLIVIFGYGCAGNSDKGETIYVQEAEGLSGYTVYIRDAAPPPTGNVYEVRKINDDRFSPSPELEPDDKEIPPGTLSTLYYYRSPNPNRLTRIRLRRFR